MNSLYLKSLITLLAATNVLWSQYNQVRFDYITSEDGLSENVVNCIFQDSKGFMWFGTHDGLNRYDGYGFTIFKPSTDDEYAINSNLIYALTEDHNGHIWVGTTGSGLNRFDPQTKRFTHFRHDLEQAESLTNDQILVLFTDSQGRVWVGTLRGLTLVEPSTPDDIPPKITRLNLSDSFSKIKVYSIVEDKSGNIWVATDHGLYKSILRDQYGDYNFQKVKFGKSFGMSSIKTLTFDKDGMMVIGTMQGLFHQIPSGEGYEFKKLSGVRNQRSIVIDNKGKIWSGTYNGLLCFESSQSKNLKHFKAAFISDTTYPYSLNNNVIRVLYKDKTGIIWAGTNGGGINKFNPERKQFYHYGRNLESNGQQYKQIRSVLEDSNRDLWVGTEGGGLFWYPFKEDDRSYYNFLPVEGGASRVFALEEVEENGQKFLYIGSEIRPFIQKINISSNVPSAPITLPDALGSVFSILQSKNKILWIGSYNGGLYRWIPQEDGSYSKRRFLTDGKKENGLFSNIIRKIYEDSRGNIWIGTGSGLNMIPADQVLEDQPQFLGFQNVHSDTTSLSHNYILDIFESSSGQIWIGTFGGGLNKLNHAKGTKKVYFTRYKEAHGLPNNSIMGIQEDNEGDLWVSTHGGLTKFDPQSEIFLNFETSDGLQSSEFMEGASTKKVNGELIFGGVNGFNIFQPSNIVGSKISPEVMFTKLLVHGQEVQPGEKINARVLLSKAIYASEEISLKYFQNDISVEFAALHYAAPKHNKYAYMLEGYHKDWREVNAEKRYATFTNLRHGDYTLYVKASNGDNIWTSQPAKLKIKINPPFWLSWYAYVFYVFFLLLTIILIRKYTIISIHEKHKLMLEHIEREKLEELNQMKLRFFTNISHELRTPLTLIISPLEHILEKGKNLSKEKLQQQYHYMYKNAKYLLRLVNQLLDFRKLDQGSFNLRVGKDNIVGFILETTEPFQFIAGKKGINFKIIDPNQKVYTFFDPDIIEKVMYNLLSNAFKFTPPGGLVSVRILEKEKDLNNQKLAYRDYIEIQVEDTGVGISRKKLKKIFNRFYKESGQKENKDGAGIGLSYTKSLVELHHGEIEVESNKGQGSCFTVSLPMNRTAYLKSEIDQLHIEGFETKSDPLEYLVAEPIFDMVPSLEGMDLADGEEGLPLLLFIDDNEDIRQFLKEGFQNDFRIISAEDGEKGYDIALSSLPDIIVSDVMMPKMNGIDLCEALKTNPLTSHIPIVLLTAKSTEEDELEGLKIGADAYVVKPFRLDILRAQLLNIHFHREKLKQRFRQEILLEPEEITVTSVDEEFLKKAVSVVEEHLPDSEFNVQALVKEMHISRSKLYLKLKALTGLSSSEFIRTVRLKRAIHLLEKSDYTIKEIMYMTGFNTASYFSKCFKKQFGVVPSEYLKNKKQEKVDGEKFNKLNELTTP